VILFAHHEEVIDALLEELREFLPCVIRGYTDEASRENAVKAFQEDTDRRLFLGSIGAAGVGLTLTASDHVVFAEESWSQKDISQCEDRAHRIGQKKSVLVTHIVFDGSLDANMMKKMVKKQEAADRALGG
jgi:SWI/SNF-related matrix-associated actin-dependent regulator 1 of chromatin subfamily A